MLHLPKDCNASEKNLPSDLPPPDLACTSIRPRHQLARFAFVLYGAVAPADRLTKTDDLLREAARSGSDIPISRFVDIQTAWSHFHAYLMHASGGADSVDSFIHSTVPSLAMRQKLLQLYHPVSARFDDSFGSVWRPRVERIAAGSGRNGSGFDQPVTEVSRFLSASIALNLVREAEDARSQPYDAIYLTRPDVLLWAVVDLRAYCFDELVRSGNTRPVHRRVMYSNNCHPPFHTLMGSRGCPADFHFVMDSEAARRFATMPEHFDKYHYFTEHPHSSYKNQYMSSFVSDVVGATLKPDHVVTGRHEETLRKAALFLEGLYQRWCRCEVAAPGTKCRWPRLAGLPEAG